MTPDAEQIIIEKLIGLEVKFDKLLQPALADHETRIRDLERGSRLGWTDLGKLVAGIGGLITILVLAKQLGWI
jgi:hypothetical protein